MPQPRASLCGPSDIVGHRPVVSAADQSRASSSTSDAKGNGDHHFCGSPWPCLAAALIFNLNAKPCWEEGQGARERGVLGGLACHLRRSVYRAHQHQLLGIGQAHHSPCHTAPSKPHALPTPCLQPVLQAGQLSPAHGSAPSQGSKHRSDTCVALGLNHLQGALPLHHWPLQLYMPNHLTAAPLLPPILWLRQEDSHQGHQCADDTQVTSCLA